MIFLFIFALPAQCSHCIFLQTKSQRQFLQIYLCILYIFSTFKKYFYAFSTIDCFLHFLLPLAFPDTAVFYKVKAIYF